MNSFDKFEFFSTMVYIWKHRSQIIKVWPNVLFNFNDTQGLLEPQAKFLKLQWQASLKFIKSGDIFHKF